MNISCQHDYQFAEVVFEEKEVGHGIKRMLEDKLICRKCLDTQYINSRLSNKQYGDETHNPK